MASIGIFDQSQVYTAKYSMLFEAQWPNKAAACCFANAHFKKIGDFHLFAPLSFIALPQILLARETRNRKIIPLEDYLTGPDGLKYYDVVEGKGPVAEKRSTAQVHFDCLYRGITAVSSRESKLLAGNRIIAQRTVIIPAEEEYGPKGMNEIPPGA